MLAKTLKEFIVYAKSHLRLDVEDAIYFENILLHEFHLDAPFDGEVDEEGIASLSVPDSLIESLILDLKLEGHDESEGERAADFILGLLSPVPSEVNRRFLSLEKEKGGKEAFLDLYKLAIDNHYFQKTRVDKNILWEAHFEDGAPLQISINLSKPEKNNKDIAKLLKTKSTDYPKCALCKENLGFYGDEKHAARTNIRLIDLSLAGEPWFLQYSPYGYFPKHLIAVHEEHTPMAICRKTFERLFDFVDRFPFFFIGSNSDLPIVGGSILNHEHFQGGEPVLPLLKAENKERVFVSEKGSVVSIVDFYISALRIEGKDRKDVIDIGERILNAWRPYTDESNCIVSGLGEERHNTVTPFAEKKGDAYRLTIGLRNNRTDEKYPDGIFHAHPEYHAIKKEGIGLIEAAGLFILPARLLRQEKEVDDVVKKNLSDEEALSVYPDIAPFFGMIKTMRERRLTSKEYINSVCQGILRNVAVYKDDEKGQKGFHAFLRSVFHD